MPCAVPARGNGFTLAFCKTPGRAVSTTKPLLRAEEVSDGINVIIDDRWAALLPMHSRAQVDHLIEAVNRAHSEALKAIG